MQSVQNSPHFNMWVIPYQINKKNWTHSDFFENWHRCWVHRETTPDQILAYFVWLLNSEIMTGQLFEAII